MCERGGGAGGITDENNKGHLNHPMPVSELEKKGLAASKY